MTCLAPQFLYECVVFLQLGRINQDKTFMSNFYDKWIFILITVISTPAWGQTEEWILKKYEDLPKVKLISAYRAINGKVVPLEDENLKLPAPELPNTLIVPSGFYTFENKVYKLDQPGLYRFYYFDNSKAGNQSVTQQRIVFDGDVQALLSAIAWLSAQGERDNSLALEELEKKALSDKINVTCSRISKLGQKILSRVKIKSRLIQTYTLDDWNGYDDSHMMLEVFLPNKKKWVLYDLTAKSYFKSNGLLLSAVDLFHRVQKGDFDLVSIANTGMSNFGKFDFLMEEIFNTPKKWYKHIYQTVMIRGDYISMSPEKNKIIQDYYLSGTYPQRKAAHYPLEVFKLKYYILASSTISRELKYYGSK
jgi:hypothetical protein